MKVLILGSGGLSIGQAGEFDYSGSQAIKALLEEKMEVVVINPNIATVQTNPQKNCKIYLCPLEISWVEKVIVQEKPQGILAGFGGQTALNLLLQLDEQALLTKYGIQNFGTCIDSLRLTEDRNLFASHMKKSGFPVLAGHYAENIEQAVEIGHQLEFPVIVRAAYTLGGLGSGFADNENELQEIAEKAFQFSPQILIEKSLKGWKELEYEIMRDSQGNAICICNMENIDPLGIHTGDSIVVAPSQTLTNDEYHTLRTCALEVANSLKIVGECNVQFALDPVSSKYFVIEVNARLSRSSALASKATGYPIAFLAAKLVLGKSLLEMRNPVTEKTSAFFEPALDYVTVKIPRWEFEKFYQSSRKLGSSMKSVGEVMAIGRRFPEAIQKALRMVTQDEKDYFKHEKMEALSDSEIDELLRSPTDQRVFVLFECFKRGYSVEKVAKMTGIDPWFLNHFSQIASANQNSLELTDLKRFGFSDAYLNISSRDRKKLRPSVRPIDTTAGEHDAKSNYQYVSYDGMPSAIPSSAKQSVLIVGGGAYHIGSSVEFDWSTVQCAKGFQKEGWRVVMLNCNPETVSTDYNSSDTLYFEEITVERIQDIVEIENIAAVVLCMGGQLPNRLAEKLHKAGIKILGHSAQAIERAENRETFSAILDKAKIPQPKWVSATQMSEVKEFVTQHGFPVLVRPSYILSGQAMNVATNMTALEHYINAATQLRPEKPVVLSSFIEGALEVELDGVSQNGQLTHFVVSEHVENAGVHSGDATLVTPTVKLADHLKQRSIEYARTICASLELHGPLNIQFLVKDDEVSVIECNARASRSFPFVSKVTGVDLAELSTMVMLGQKISAMPILPLYGVKSPVFSFHRLDGVDPILGVEMASTGEVGCVAPEYENALLLSLLSSGHKIPKRGIVISAGEEKSKLKFLEIMGILKELKVPLYATSGTAKFFKTKGFDTKEVPWPDEGSPNVLNLVKEGTVDCVINIPRTSKRDELTRSSFVRLEALRTRCSLFTNAELAIAYFKALHRKKSELATYTPKPLFH